MKLKISMNNGQVDTVGQRSIGYEGNHLAHTLTVATDLEEPWALKLDLRYPEGGAANVVDLVRSGSDCAVELTRDILRQNGMYTCQLRGLLTYALRTVTVGRTHYNPYPEEMLRSDGYLPVVETPAPEVSGGFYPVSRYEAREGEIVRVWTLEPMEVAGE